jgi:AcrR family transcriptional regulator
MSEITSTTPQSRGPADHNVREQILEAAGEHFSHYGYDKTTVSDLAKAIGFSKAYIYKFFNSKQAIGEAICAKTLSALVAAVEEAVAGASTPTEKFRRMFKALTATGVSLFFNDRKLRYIARIPPARMAVCAPTRSASGRS